MTEIYNMATNEEPTDDKSATNLAIINTNTENKIVLEAQKEIILKTIELKRELALEHLKNIRKQQSYERRNKSLGNFMRFNILYILPAILSSGIGYSIHTLGKSAKLVIIRAIMIIPFLTLEAFSILYNLLLKVLNFSIISYFNIFSSQTPIESPNATEFSNIYNASFLTNKYDILNENLDTISQKSLDVIVTFMLVSIYIIILFLFHILVKCEDIKKIQIGWTNITIDTKEERLTISNEINEMMQSANSLN